jgi:peptidoglycan/xylan/chitin deacetylase (PgdA/CDA1 family)
VKTPLFGASTNSKIGMALLSLVLLAACGTNSAAPTTSTTQPSSGIPQTPDGSPAARRPTSTDAGLVDYSGPVEHIFFHPLIVYPKTVFSGSESQGFNEYFVTIPEFKKMLAQLYEKNWILVDLNTLYQTSRAGGKVAVKVNKLRLPKGKKPLVVSIDDLNYYEYMAKNHLNERLVIDPDGNVAAAVTSPAGEKIISRDTEIVPILDQFVEAHPDFSLNGAKGTIALTGYQGILGYRTAGNLAKHPKQAQAEVAPVVKRLKETGWNFASHSYGHMHSASVSLGYFKTDTDKWQRTVANLVGPTATFIFPFGETVPVGSPKFKYLQHKGFRFFCPIGPTALFEVGHGYVIQSRVHVDGISLLTQPKTLRRFFDPKTVVDKSRPKLYPS